MIDLFSADTPLGQYAKIYCLTTLFLYRHKFHFFEDRLSTLPLMTSAFTIISYLMQLAIFMIMSKPFALSWEWAFQDLALLPLQMALYSLLFFTFPLFLLRHLKRRYLLFRLARRKL
jgi:hypothetical protein